MTKDSQAGAGGVVHPVEFTKGDDFTEEGAKYKTFGIHANDHKHGPHLNKIAVYDDEALRDRILAALAPSPGEPFGWVVGSHFYKEDPGALSGKIAVYTTPPATPVQPTASVDFDTWWAGRDRSYHEGWRAIAKEAWQLGGVHAEQCMKARASLTPAPTQGEGS